MQWCLRSWVAPVLQLVRLRTCLSGRATLLRGAVSKYRMAPCSALELPKATATLKAAASMLSLPVANLAVLRPAALPVVPAADGSTAGVCCSQRRAACV